MSRFNKLTHAIWYCHYHVVWVPKYRLRILEGALKREVERCIKMYAEQKQCAIKELNVQVDHVHILIMIPPKHSISDVVGTIKGRTAIRVFKKFPSLKKRPYWGNHFWAKGYCVDTVGLDFDKVQKYIKYQEKKEKEIDN